MAAAAKHLAPPAPAVRRFDLADFTYHGPWLFPRLLHVFPHLQEQQIAGWLRGVIELNTFLFLRTDNGVALFELVNEQLAPAPMVRERFVLCKNKDQHAAEASWFYDDALRWGRSCGASAIEVECYTDVPHELIRERLGLRLFNIERVVARL